MNLPASADLRREGWAKLSMGERLEAIQNLERDLAAQEGREACNIGFIPEEERELRDSEAVRRGQFSKETNEIQLDRSLLDVDRPPYQAVETYFHEARHAYQAHAISNPEVHSDQAQLEDWRINDAAYVNEEDFRLGASYSHYRWQPLEADANQVSRERTDGLFAGQFEDESQYPSYAAQKAAEFSASEMLAQSELGVANYQDEARQFILSKYESQMTREEGIAEPVSGQPSRVTVEAPSEESAPVAPQESDPDETESQEEDYGYGYGP